MHIYVKKLHKNFIFSGVTVNNKGKEDNKTKIRNLL